VTSREFRDGDLSLLLGLAQELWPRVRCTFGEIAFWSAQLPQADWEARLWFDGARLAGWGWLTGGEELAFDGGADVVDEIVAWAQPREVLSLERDAELLAAHGLTHVLDAPWTRRNSRALADLEEPFVPPGYRLATMADYGDVASRSAAHRSAFAPYSRFTDQVYEVVRATWPYRADLDCVAVAPDGAVASYTLAWLDEQNRIGELEPVGTHAEHRRRGLGRAVNLFALQRLRDAGAEMALVSCRGDDAYPIPCKLYGSVGFREVTRKVPFRRG
jgi:ribosomal protein S18 acetylase RimI-like enzyme